MGSNLTCRNSSKRHSSNSNSQPSSPTEERDGNSSSPSSKVSFGEIDGPQNSSLSEESQIEKNSRRAMIVKMAKARMANSGSQHADDVSGNSSFPSVQQGNSGNSGNSWDIAGDLD